MQEDGVAGGGVPSPLNVAVREDRVRALCKPASPRIDWSRGWWGLWPGSTSVKISAKGRTNDRYCDRSAQGHWRR
jgi:hypothetical protein